MNMIVNRTGLGLGLGLGFFSQCADHQALYYVGRKPDFQPSDETG